MSRWRNYGLWVSIVSFIMMVLQTYHLVELPPNIQDIVNALLSLLVTAGILSNPKEGAGFLDEKSNAE